MINFYFHVHSKIELSFLKGVKFSGIEIFSGGWLDRPGYFNGVEKFSDGVKVFEKLRIFQVGGLRLFHNGSGNFRVVETITRSDVFSFFCRLRFSFFFDGGGGRLIFSQKLKLSHGIKIFMQ